MIVIVGTVRVADGAVARARPAMAGMVEASRGEAGCLAGTYGPNRFGPDPLGGARF